MILGSEDSLVGEFLFPSGTSLPIPAGYPEVGSWGSGSLRGAVILWIAGSPEALLLPALGRRWESEPRGWAGESTKPGERALS